jgi:hypothetical protein
MFDLLYRVQSTGKIALVGIRIYDQSGSFWRGRWGTLPITNALIIAAFLHNTTEETMSDG